MIKKRFYFDVGDTDEGRISLVRGFFYGYLKNLENRPADRGIIVCPTLEDTHSCSMAAFKDTPKTVDLGDGEPFEDFDRGYTDADNTDRKEAVVNRPRG